VSFHAINLAEQPILEGKTTNWVEVRLTFSDGVMEKCGINRGIMINGDIWQVRPKS